MNMVKVNFFSRKNGTFTGTERSSGKPAPSVENNDELELSAARLAAETVENQKKCQIRRQSGRRH
ncbi:unnamed protein product [Arabis nemorensis]|uniref:Uncharacterized protein n=1 Tax=Arabis nemorensis TaxID=586526 RepID=A0A565AZ28_9BRAS|nr:unnamed protein product [Arabis nemorensis]